MIIKVDAKALEWRGALDLSGDEVGIQEIRDGVDQHGDNQKRFGFPAGDEGRLIAKIFLFRLLFGGSAYAYANDSQFTGVSSSDKYWQGIIDETYAKYKGLAKWHKEIVQTATTTGKLRLPTGREFDFKPMKNKRGELQWPITTIKNYPVQSYSADLVMIARISAWRRLRSKALFISTVHDSIDLDCENNPDLLYSVALELEKCFEDVPENMKRLYGHEMKVPIAGEVSFGRNYQHQVKFKKDLGPEQFILK